MRSRSAPTALPFLASFLLLGACAMVGSNNEARGPSMPAMPIAPMVQLALETKASDDPVVWTSADEQARATVTILATFKREDGTYCRRYAVVREQIPAALRKENHGMRCRDRELGIWVTPETLRGPANSIAM